MKLVIDFSAIAKKIRECITGFVLFAKVPITAIQYASAALIMLAFGALIPTVFFFPQVIILKIFAIFGISCVIYYITEWLLHFTKTPNKSKQ